MRRSTGSVNGQSLPVFTMAVIIMSLIGQRSSRIRSGRPALCRIRRSRFQECDGRFFAAPLIASCRRVRRGKRMVEDAAASPTEHICRAQPIGIALAQRTGRRMVKTATLDPPPAILLQSSPPGFARNRFPRRMPYGSRWGVSRVLNEQVTCGTSPMLPTE